MDSNWYLDLNRVARQSTWAHRLVTDFVDRLPPHTGIGLVLLAITIIGAWWAARRSLPERVAAVAWAALGGAVALGLNLVLMPVLARPRPYQVLANVEVLVPRATGYAMPNGHCAVAGAVVVGLLLARRWRWAAAAGLVSLALMFSLVYVGADYPSDVAAGIGFGAAIEVVLWPLGAWLLVPLVESVADSALGWTVSSRRARAGQRPIGARTTTNLPDARAMAALRKATEAARQGNH